MANEWAVLPASTVAWSRPGVALVEATRESLAHLFWDGWTRAARLLRRLLGAMVDASARVTRALQQAANRLEEAELAGSPLLPDEWLLEAEPTADLRPARRPPPIPVEARRPPPLLA